MGDRSTSWMTRVAQHFCTTKNGHWKVGKDTGDANCWLNARDSAMTPDLITAQWRVWDGTVKSWEDAPSVGITSRGEYGNEHAMQQQ